MRRLRMITCYLRYEISPLKAKEFETYARMWMPLVEKFGGTHHGYFLPHEGGDYVAIALFSFPSLADYEVYRSKAASDPDCQRAIAYYLETKCFLRHDRSFLRPILETGAGALPKPAASS
jgi:hypothetical protein